MIMLLMMSRHKGDKGLILAISSNYEVTMSIEHLAP